MKVIRELKDCLTMAVFSFAEYGTAITIETRVIVRSVPTAAGATVSIDQTRRQ